MPSNAGQISVMPQTNPSSHPADAAVGQAVVGGIAAAQQTAKQPTEPPSAGGRQKETGAKNVDTAEIPAVHVIETEPTVEMEPEVEAWVEKVERGEIKVPEQVIVADKTAQAPTGRYAAQPVIVLPLTQQKTQEGLTVSVTRSFRWLAEWCKKIIDKFHGVVVYRKE